MSVHMQEPQKLSNDALGPGSGSWYHTFLGFDVDVDARPNGTGTSHPASISSACAHDTPCAYGTSPAARPIVQLVGSIVIYGSRNT